MFGITFYKVLNINSPVGHRYVDDINSYKPPRLPQTAKTALVEHYVDSKGVKRIKGSKAMKSSQSYPRQFPVQNFKVRLCGVR